MCTLDLGEGNDTSYGIVLGADRCRDVAKVATVLDGVSVVVPVDIGNDATDISSCDQIGSVHAVLDCESGTVGLQIANHASRAAFAIDAAIGDVILKTWVIELTGLSPSF